jgi:hypothetical protein
LASSDAENRFVMLIVKEFGSAPVQNRHRTPGGGEKIIFPDLLGQLVEKSIHSGREAVSQERAAHSASNRARS